MKVFVCTDHDGFWPVGAASVVVADTEDAARGLLRLALAERGLKPDTPFTLREIELSTASATILLDGDY